MISRLVEPVLEFAGRLYGRQTEALVCQACDKDVGPWGDSSPVDCPDCGEPLSVAVPKSEELVILWRLWKGDQEWWPQRYWIYRGTDGPTERYWQWRGRQWRVREAVAPWDTKE